MGEISRTKAGDERTYDPIYQPEYEIGPPRGFAIIDNLDKSALLLNPVLEKEKVRFSTLFLDELEQLYGQLFFDGQTSRILQISVPDRVERISVSREFRTEILKNSNFIRNRIKEWGYIVTLEPTDIEFTKPLDLLHWLNKLTKSLLLTLRLTKPGYIAHRATYVLHGGTQIHAQQQHGARPKQMQVFNIEPSDIHPFETVKNRDKPWKEICSLSIKLFESSYEVQNVPFLVLITLIAAVESLLNRGQNELTHTVARHGALMISDNELEFKTNYDGIKTAYIIRSDFAHGRKMVQPKIWEQISYLQEAIPKIIFYVQDSDYTEKKALFNYLNARGYPQGDDPQTLQSEVTQDDN